MELLYGTRCKTLHSSLLRPLFFLSRAFASVILPLMRVPLTGALILVFVFTLGSYLLPQLLGRPQHWTLSVHITDQAVFQSNLPFAAAMAVLLLLVSLALVGLALLLGSGREAAR